MDWYRVKSNKENTHKNFPKGSMGIIYITAARHPDHLDDQYQEHFPGRSLKEEGTSIELLDDYASARIRQELERLEDEHYAL